MADKLIEIKAQKILLLICSLDAYFQFLVLYYFASRLKSANYYNTVTELGQNTGICFNDPNIFKFFTWSIGHSLESRINKPWRMHMERFLNYELKGSSQMQRSTDGQLQEFPRDNGHMNETCVHRMVTGYNEESEEGKSRENSHLQNSKGPV